MRNEEGQREREQASDRDRNKEKKREILQSVLVPGVSAGEGPAL